MITICFILTTYNDEGIPLFLRRSGGINTWTQEPHEAFFFERGEKMIMTIKQRLDAIENLTEEMHLSPGTDNWVLIKWNIGEARKLLDSISAPSAAALPGSATTSEKTGQS